MGIRTPSYTGQGGPLVLRVQLSPRLHRPALVATIAVVVTGALLALRGAGALAPGELAVFDRMLRASRPEGVEDPRVLIVPVTESDIQALGYPLSDEVL